MTFRDFSTPFYDRAEHDNTAYNKMLRLMRELMPRGASVFETSAGNGSISLEVADKAKEVICTDISEKMLMVANKKVIKRGALNITFSKRSLFDTGELCLKFAKFSRAQFGFCNFT
jgi:ubiquinone/menaquinone biosynthesis C-methylase UbiE